MARSAKWTDEWVLQLKHPEIGEIVYPDPTLNKFRLVVKKTKKVFELQSERPAQYGPRKTWVVQVGAAPLCTVNDARKRAVAALALVAQGLDPHPKKETRPSMTTLGSAWAEYQTRADIRSSTMRVYESSYRRKLVQWADTPLKLLLDNPAMARDEHRRITKEKGPSDANHAMRLLRSIYRYAACLDTSLSRVRHPCEAVEWHKENKRKGAAIPAEKMPAWAAQTAAMREKSPLRASFAVLNLRLGTRPGELARAKWSDVDWDRKVLVLPETKTELVEVPLTNQILTELEHAREAGAAYPGNPHIFPARGKTGHLMQFTEPKKALSHSGNSGRHTHHTIGTLLGPQCGIDEMTLDVLEGRSLLKAGAGAGRGYIDRIELGPKIRAAQENINDEIDRLFDRATTTPSTLPNTPTLSVEHAAQQI